MNICSVKECGGVVKGHGFCQKHYLRFKKHGSTDKFVWGTGKRKHPYYSFWFERKQMGVLCEEWTDFWKFVDGIGDRPEGYYLLVRLDGSKLYGPDNFKWQLHLKRQEGESKKEWWARKWQARHAGNRSLEKKRDLRRKFGLTWDKYLEMRKDQNDLCAICGKSETAVDSGSGATRKLSIDHCHKTGKVRELLCWRCNVTLGKLEDNRELLKKFDDYLLKHSN